MNEKEILQKRAKTQKICFFICLPITIIVVLWKIEYKLACLIIYCMGFILWHNYQIAEQNLKNYELQQQIDQLKAGAQKDSVNEDSLN